MMDEVVIVKEIIKMYKCENNKAIDIHEITTKLNKGIRFII